MSAPAPRVRVCGPNNELNSSLLLEESRTIVYRYVLPLLQPDRYFATTISPLSGLGTLYVSVVCWWLP